MPPALILGALYGFHYYVNPSLVSPPFSSNWNSGKEIPRGSQKYCDVYLKEFFRPSPEEMPPWFKFQTSPDKICSALIEQPKENLKYLLRQASSWKILNDPTREVTDLKVHWVSNVQKELKPILDVCNFGCPPLINQSAFKYFDQQNIVSRLLLLRWEREFRHADYYQHTDSKNDRLLDDKAYQHIANLLKEEKNAYRQLTREKDPVLENPTLSITEKEDLKEYYQTEEARLKKLHENSDQQLLPDVKTSSPKKVVTLKQTQQSTGSFNR